MSSADRYPVPGIRGSRTSRFFPVLGITFLAWVIGWPFFTLGFLNRSDDPDVAWIHRLYQRKDIALRRVAQSGRPRLVVVGGSGALFGIDADLIGRRLGVDAVNQATHAGLDTYILHRAQKVLRPGDNVLLCPEHELWRRKEMPQIEWDYATTYDKRFLWHQGVGGALKALYSVPGDDYAASLAAWRNALRKHEAPAGYIDAAFGPLGDIRIPPPTKPFKLPTDEALPDPTDPRYDVSAFAIFGQWTRANRVRVFFTWPNRCRVPSGPLEDGPSTQSLRAMLEGFGFIPLDNPTDNEFPASWFYDSIYHLDGGARRIRTEAVIRRLAPFFNPPSVPMSSQIGGIYLVGHGTSWLRDGNAFTSHPNVRPKYLVSSAADSPDAITPGQLLTLARQGVPVYCDDPTIEAALPPDDWSWREVAREDASLGSLFKRFDHHLIVLASSGFGGEGDPSIRSDVPSEVARAVYDREPVVAVIGSGPWSGIHRTVRDPHAVQLEGTLAKWVGRDVPWVSIRASAQPGRASIRVNDRPFASSERGEICAAVFEPEQAILLAAATFPAGGSTRLWSMREYSPRADAPADTNR